MEIKDNYANGEIDVEKEIEFFYSYNKHQKRGYHCAYTEGMEKFGCPELCLMDYYPPEEAEYILMNMADCILNGTIHNEETGTYDLYSIVELSNDADEVEYRFGFVGGWLYENETIMLQEVDEDGFPIHPGGESLLSYSKRGFEVWPMFMYYSDDEEECE